MSTLKQVVSNPMPQSTQDDSEEWSIDAHWPTLVHGLADQITQSLSALQNNLDQLLLKERITRLEHRALSIPAERIKQAGLVAQQIHRFHAGRIRQSHERINMAELVENLLQERRKEFAVVGVELRRKLKPVDVLPYATQWPRPVVGANGLTVQPWHPQWERNGGPQLTRRFARQENRPMLGHDWAAWAATKAVAAALVDAPRAPVAQHIQRLRTGQSYIDGFKGPRLSFRAWDGQLRQPLFVAHGDGVAGVAPLDGVLHPKEVLDTLGVDEAETACKAR